jgi:ABC-type sugar transport system ATPase subunit
MSLVKGLVRDYEGFKLDIPEWEIPDEGVTALWGPSGSGKTTAFRLLIGLDPCPGLTWNFGSVDVAALPVPQRHLGVVFQTLELFPHMTAKENILFAARTRNLPERAAQDRLRELAHDLQLQSCLERKAAVLSGGEAQRVALARAVIGRPRFLFLDEPFSSLDHDLKVDARALVNEVIQKLNVPTLLITHDQDDLAALAQTVVKIRNGRLVLGR